MPGKDLGTVRGIAVPGMDLGKGTSSALVRASRRTPIDSLTTMSYKLFPGQSERDKVWRRGEGADGRRREGEARIVQHRQGRE